MLVFASTAGGAAPFERPYEADFLSVHLGGLDVMAVGHLGDTSEASTAEAFDEARISVGVEHTRASSGVTRVLAVLARLWGTRTLGSRKVAVPGGWHSRERSHSRGADSVCDVHKVGAAWSFPRDEGVDVHEVILLGFVEDTIYCIHTDGWGSTQIEDVVE